MHLRYLVPRAYQWPASIPRGLPAKRCDQLQLSGQTPFDVTEFKGNVFDNEIFPAVSFRIVGNFRFRAEIYLLVLIVQKCSLFRMDDTIGFISCYYDARGGVKSGMTNNYTDVIYV